MKNLMIWRLFVFICFLVSCKNDNRKPASFKGKDLSYIKIAEIDSLEKRNNNAITINIPENHSNIIRTSQILDSCFYIPLETKKENLIGEIDKIKVVDDKIFILDSRVAKSIYIFSMDGTFLRKIGNEGKGPGEYLWPQDFDIDVKNKEVLVFNGNVSKILRYNFSGTFLGSITLNVRCVNFCILKDGNIALYTDIYQNKHLESLSNKLIYIINKEGDILRTSPSINDNFKNIDISLLQNSMVENGFVSFSPKFSDSIFSLEHDQITLTYKLNFGNNVLNKEKLTDTDGKQFLKETKKFPLFLGRHLQTEEYLYFNYIIDRETVNGYYSKKQDRLLIGKEFNFDDIKYILFSSAIPIGVKNDYFIANTYPSDIMERKKSLLAKPEVLKMVKGDPTIKTLLNMEEGDNPILIFYKLNTNMDE